MTAPTDQDCSKCKAYLIELGWQNAKRYFAPEIERLRKKIIRLQRGLK